MYGRVLSCTLGGLVAMAACVNTDLGGVGPRPLLDSGGSGGGGAGGDGLTLDSGPGGPPPPDAAGYCGNDVHQVSVIPPTVYFVFDISGSMSTPVPGGTRFSVVQSAAAKLVEEM